MRLCSSTAPIRTRRGYLFIECLVYLSVFVVVFSLALGAFYVCWDHSKALHLATDDITAALHAGERWRADIRGATGNIIGETIPGGEQLHIPGGTNDIIYRFGDGEVRRQIAGSGFSELLLSSVKASDMVNETRGPVDAWRWELCLTPRRKETRLPLAFTFEAAARPTP
ncbi:MAG TPA: hypothetical protein VMB80_16500 [Candidatus Acidoferrum sp.]|nr:hypothetical protein [Candidatus Acidoferrum sp.]